MIELEHKVDWPECGKDRDGLYMAVVCTCGWQSTARHREDSGNWWCAWSRHLSGVISAEQYVQSQAAR